MRSSSARCLASKGEGGSGALGAGVDDLLPNSAENGNGLGRVSVAGLSFAALSFAALSFAGLSFAGLSVAGLAAAVGCGAVPVFGSGAGTGSGTFSLTAGSAEAEGAPRVATAIATMVPQHKPMTARQRFGATAMGPDLARRFGAIIPLPLMRCICTPPLRPPA